MRMGFSSWTKWTAPMLIALSLSGVGCKSGWKMPGASMFPWSRQPSESTLAGDSATPKLEGPAANHTPTALASAAAGTKSATTASYAGGAPATTPKTGVAAASNGYQTGPYPMSGYGGAQGSTATPNQVTPSGSPTAMTGYPSGSYLPNNSYQGTAGLPSGNANPYAASPYGQVANNAARPGATAQGSLANFPSGTSGYAGGPTGAPNYPAPPSPYNGGTPYNAGSAGGTSSSVTGTPQNYSMPIAAPPSAGMPNYHPQAAAGTYGASASPAGYSAPAYGSPNLPPSAPAGASLPTGAPSSGPYSSPNISLPGAAPAGGTPSATLQQGTSVGAVTPAGYRPGSTGRTNTYSFGQGAAPTVPGSAPAGAMPGASMPAAPAGSLPASPAGYGGFQLPPNTANATGPGLSSPVPPAGGHLYR